MPWIFGGESGIFDERANFFFLYANYARSLAIIKVGKFYRHKPNLLEYWYLGNFESSNRHVVDVMRCQTASISPED